MNDRFVLVAWPPTKDQINLGWKLIQGNLRPDEIYPRMCAASPVAADDPAMVERVARVLAPLVWTAVTDGRDVRQEGNWHLRREWSKQRALAVLRLFSPPKE